MSGFSGLRRRLLRVPLFYKLFLANVVIVVAAVAVTAWITRAHLVAEPGLAAPVAWLVFGAAVVLVSLAANAVLVRLALFPLRDLERTARGIAKGDPSRRAPLSPLADRDLARVIRAFNEMLDRLARYRRRLRELSIRSLDAQEDERKRIARELHDDTAQRIVAVGLRLSALRRRAEGDELTRELEQAHRELGEAVESLRTIARGLRPPALDELGLLAALEAHAREVGERAGFRVEVERPPEPPGLPPEAELAAYRIVQEALSNVQRHARATRVRLALRREADGLHVTVEDDGMGFRPGGSGDRTDQTLGLFGMQERASHVNGRLEVESAPGRGTRVTLTLPPTGVGS